MSTSSSNSNFSAYLERNAAFATGEIKKATPAVPFLPNRQLYVITCVDPRVEPSGILGAEYGDAVVARNIGGRVTPDLIKDLAWVVHLHENLAPDADWFELAVIHHNDCGSSLFARDDLRAGNAARGGWDEETALAMAVLEPAKTVVEDIEKLRAAPALRPTVDRLRIGGYAHDIYTGRITTVVAPV
jgi:carbonic anhydrase